MISRVQTAPSPYVAPALPYITVSPIGTSTSGIKKANNGAAFGPDTPGTTTQGLQEAFNASVAQVDGIMSFVGCPSLMLMAGIFNLNSTVTIRVPVGVSTNAVAPPEIIGAGHIATQIVVHAGEGIKYGQYAWQDAVIRDLSFQMYTGGTATSLISMVGAGASFPGTRSWMMLDHVWFENPIDPAGLPSNGCIYFGPSGGFTGGFDLYISDSVFAGSFSITSPFDAHFVNSGVCAGDLVKLITSTTLTTFDACTIVGPILLTDTNQQVMVSHTYWNSIPTTGAVIASTTTGTTHVSIRDSKLLFLGASSLVSQTASAVEVHAHGNFAYLIGGALCNLVQGGCYLTNTSTYGGNSPAATWGEVGNFIQAVTLSANPPVTGTQYQNTTAIAIILSIPITYSPTGGAAATCVVALGSQSGATTISTDTIPAGGPTGMILTTRLRVPPGWYYKFTVTNATIGTGTVTPEQ